MLGLSHGLAGSLLMLIDPRRLLSVSLTAMIVLLPAQLMVHAQPQGNTWVLDGPAFSAAPSALQVAASAIHAEPLTDVTVLFEQAS